MTRLLNGIMDDCTKGYQVSFPSLMLNVLKIYLVPNYNSFRYPIKIQRRVASV